MTQKILKAAIAVFTTLCVATLLFIAGKCFTKIDRDIKCKKAKLTYCKLDHNIYISTDSTTTICDEQITGWSPSCGPSPAGWPMAFPYRWEVFLVESPHYYFARLIYHEYVLWMSFDQPYVLVKIPKSHTTADWATNTSARYTILWDITHKFELGYNDPQCLDSPQVYDINGHYTSFGNNVFSYSKYVVVHDVNHPW